MGKQDIQGNTKVYCLYWFRARKRLKDCFCVQHTSALVNFVLYFSSISFTFSVWSLTCCSQSSFVIVSDETDLLTINVMKHRHVKTLQIWHLGLHTLGGLAFCWLAYFNRSNPTHIMVSCGMWYGISMCAQGLMGQMIIHSWMVFKLIKFKFQQEHVISWACTIINNQW